MPLWTIHHPTDAYTEEDKQAFSQDITSIYTRIGLPAFYVVTVFQPYQPGTVLIGGEPADRAVRVVVEHIAVHVGDPAGREGIRRSVQQVITPWTTERGLYSEFHVDETPRELWMVDGFDPPPFGSKAEKTWAQDNRPSPY